MFDKIFEKLKKIRLEYVLIFVVSAVVTGVVYFSFFKADSDVSSKTETEKYVDSLEEKLSKALSKVEGAGSVSVMITVSSGIRTEILKDEKTTSENGKTVTTSTPVLVSGKPIVLTELYPEISGVLIVSKGANDVKVKLALLNAATTTLGVSCDKIQILNQ